jgi:hypothetical protein
VVFLGLGKGAILGNPEAQQALNDLGQIFQDNFLPKGRKKNIWLGST